MTAPSPEQGRRFWISEKQLTSLRKGRTHTALEDKKGILQAVWEDQMIMPTSHSNIQTEREKVRPEVMKFAEALEKVLKKNDYKGGWSEMSLGEIFDRIQDEMDEAKIEWNAVKKREQYEKVSMELIDVTNFCMMFYNNLHMAEHRQGEQNTKPKPLRICYSNSCNPLYPECGCFPDTCGNNPGELSDGSGEE